VRVSTPSHRGPIALLIAGIGLALALYQPWRSVPFDILDFSEFLPILQGESTFASRLASLIRYYAQEHGRFNVLPYALLALKWTFFQDNSVLWQTARFAQMSLVVVGAFLVLTRLGIPRRAAVVPALLFITAGTAAPGWTRLTMAEPLGTLLFLAAALLACGYPESTAWKQRALGISGLLVAAVLAKEMLVGVIPFVLLLALRNPLGSARGTPWSPQAGWLIVSVGAGVAAAALPIVLLAIQAPPQAFAGLYGEAPPRVSHFVLNFLLFSLPASPVLLAQNMQSFLLTNYLFFVLITFGYWQALRARIVDRAWLVLSGIALTLPLAAAVLYLPWPQVQPFYGLPYLMGSSILLSQALAGTENGPPVARWFGRLASALILVGTATTSQRLATMSFAQREQQFQVARYIAESQPLDSLRFAVRKRPPVAWEGTGPTLGRYTEAVFNTSRLAAADILCDDARELLLNPPARTLLISVSFECGPLPSPQHVVVGRYRYISWPVLGIREDSIRADFWISPARRSGSARSLMDDRH
jgi:hypothetical protein